MRVLLACLLLSSSPAFAAENAKTSLQAEVDGMAAEQKAGGSPEAALSRLFSENPSPKRLEEPPAAVRKTAAPRPVVETAPPRPRSLPSAPPPAASEPVMPAADEPVVALDPQTTLYQSEKDKMSVLAALGYLKIGIMQGGAVAVYGFESLGQVTNHTGGPKGELLSVMNSAIAQGVLAAVSAAVSDDRHPPGLPPR